MPYAIDLFCGAGGFSEGILQAGFDIVFSSDKSPMVEETYTNRHKQLGIVEGIDTHFELADIKELEAEKIFSEINKLKYGDIFEYGNIDVIFGGPPCQGFSRLGKRDSKDPRNMLFHEYLRIIKDVNPKYVVMENVTGILDMLMLDFPSVLTSKLYEGQNLVKEILKKELEGLGYVLLDVQVLNAEDFGVPQKRNRVVFLAYRKDVAPIEYPNIKEQKNSTVHDALGDLYFGKEEYSTDFSKKSVMGRTLNKKGQPVSRNSLTNMELSKHEDIIIERFSLYNQGENRNKAVARLRKEGIDLKKLCPNLFYDSLFQLNAKTNYDILRKYLSKNNNLKDELKNEKWLKFTNKQLSLLFIYSQSEEYGFNKALKSLSQRIKLGKKETIEFWDYVSSKINQELTEEVYLESLKRGLIDDKMAEAIFTKKNIRVRLDAKSSAPTMVTLPDDFIHPYFNRVLTVREMARLQSFDDSFQFLGKRTTGGDKRSQETPQFTQVGNAVPPLLAKSIAEEVYIALEKVEVK